MAESTVMREDILAALRSALEPLDYVYAMWEGGAASFNRVDEWSDIDLQVDADDERIAEVVAASERALESLAGIELRYEIPQPSWHGHWQAFYRLKNTSPYLLVDFVVIKHSNPEKFLTREIHGNAVVHFDKRNVVRPEPLDAESFTAKLAGRIDSLRILFDMFHVLTLKELNRGNDIEAIAFYHAYALRPLVEALRIKHIPARYNFNTRYLYYDLPREVVDRLKRFFFVADAAEMRERCSEGKEWMEKTLSEIDLEDVMGLVRSGRR